MTTSIPTIHIVQPDVILRTRLLCPHCGHHCYGTAQHYHDTSRFFLDCGTSLDWGHGVWRRPPTAPRPRTKRSLRAANKRLAGRLRIPQRQVDASLRLSLPSRGRRRAPGQLALPLE